MTTALKWKHDGVFWEALDPHGNVIFIAVNQDGGKAWRTRGYILYRKTGPGVLDTEYADSGETLEIAKKRASELWARSSGIDHRNG